MNMLEDVHEHDHVESLLDVFECSLLEGATKLPPSRGSQRIKVDAVCIEPDFAGGFDEIPDVAADVEKALSCPPPCDVASNGGAPPILRGANEFTTSSRQGKTACILVGIRRRCRAREVARRTLHDRESVAVDAQSVVFARANNRVLLFAAKTPTAKALNLLVSCHTSTLSPGECHQTGSGRLRH